jgi:hypothetical protein
MLQLQMAYLEGKGSGRGSQVKEKATQIIAGHTPNVTSLMTFATSTKAGHSLILGL